MKCDEAKFAEASKLPVAYDLNLLRLRSKFFSVVQVSDGVPIILQEDLLLGGQISLKEGTLNLSS